MEREAVYYGEVEYGNAKDSVLMDINKPYGHRFLCRGWVFNDFLGKRVKVVITELEKDSQEDTIMSKVQELELVPV